MKVRVNGYQGREAETNPRMLRVGVNKKWRTTKRSFHFNMFQIKFFLASNLPMLKNFSLNGKLRCLNMIINVPSSQATSTSASTTVLINTLKKSLSFWKGYCSIVLFHDICDLEGTMSHKSLFYNIERYGNTCITSAIISGEFTQK